MSEELHFTYQSPSAEPILRQGDVLQRTPALEKILKDVHPHYFKAPSYRYFIVLTQSCDLAHKKARYITIAGVRPLTLLIERLIDEERNQLAKIACVCSDSKKSKISEQLRKLVHNNFDGFFYLHEQPQLNFPEPMCAFLPLSIALRTSDHYENLVEARVLSLNDVFQAKLGWMLGNMYSRVGTQDFVETAMSKSECNDLIGRWLDQASNWCDGKKLSKARLPKDTNAETLTKEEARAIIDRVNLPNIPKEASRRVVEIAQAVFEENGVTPDQSAWHELGVQLEKDAVFTSKLKK